MHAIREGAIINLFQPLSVRNDLPKWRRSLGEKRIVESYFSIVDD